MYIFILNARLSGNRHYMWKHNIDRRAFIYKTRLIYKSCRRGYFLILSYQNIYFNKTQFNTTMKNLVKVPQLCTISYATIFNIINKSNLIPLLMRIQLALLFSFHSLESLSPSATSAVTAISDNNPFKYTYVPIFSLFILYMWYQYVLLMTAFTTIAFS